MKAVWGSASLAAVLLLAGCSAAAPASSVETTAPAEASESAEPADTAADTGTVQQWASVIAEEVHRWDDWAEDWDASMCSSFAVSEGDLLCAVAMLSASMQASTTQIRLEAASNPDAPVFIAEQPPAEIADLYADTLATATLVDAAGQAWMNECNGQPEAAGCDARARDFDFGIGQLMSQLAAWGPYL